MNFEVNKLHKAFFGSFTKVLGPDPDNNSNVFLFFCFSTKLQKHMKVLILTQIFFPLIYSAIA